MQLCPRKTQYTTNNTKIPGNFSLHSTTLLLILPRKPPIVRTLDSRHIYGPSALAGRRYSPLVS
jgi:hypothetical protein